jgi:metal-responsive CopG/Arc/MetJ family transcriptional regulator
VSPRPGPPMPVTPVRLSADLLARVDAAAAVVGVNRSEMIRRLIADGLEKR